jgi:hypothetical protein
VAQAALAAAQLPHQDALLDRGGEEQQGHELREPRAGDAERAGCCGVVGQLAGLDEALDVVRERERPGGAAGRGRGGRRPRAAHDGEPASDGRHAPPPGPADSGFGPRA